MGLYGKSPKFFYSFYVYSKTINEFRTPSVSTLFSTRRSTYLYPNQFERDKYVEDHSVLHIHMCNLL